MTRDEQRAYSRGYNAGSRGRWPEHKPPMPPDPLLNALLMAAQQLRDAVDGQLAVLDDSDDITLELGPKIDAMDAAMSDLGQWVREPVPNG